MTDQTAGPRSLPFGIEYYVHWLTSQTSVAQSISRPAIVFKVLDLPSVIVEPMTPQGVRRAFVDFRDNEKYLEFERGKTCTLALTDSALTELLTTPLTAMLVNLDASTREPLSSLASLWPDVTLFESVPGAAQPQRLSARLVGANRIDLSGFADSLLVDAAVGGVATDSLRGYKRAEFVFYTSSGVSVGTMSLTVRVSCLSRPPAPPAPARPAAASTIPVATGLSVHPGVGAGVVPSRAIDAAAADAGLTDQRARDALALLSAVVRRLPKGAGEASHAVHPSPSQALHQPMQNALPAPPASARREASPLLTAPHLAAPATAAPAPAPASAPAPTSVPAPAPGPAQTPVSARSSVVGAGGAAATPAPGPIPSAGPAVVFANVLPPVPSHRQSQQQQGSASYSSSSAAAAASSSSSSSSARPEERYEPPTPLRPARSGSAGHGRGGVGGLWEKEGPRLILDALGASARIGRSVPAPRFPPKPEDSAGDVDRESGFYDEYGYWVPIPAAQQEERPRQPPVSSPREELREMKHKIKLRGRLGYPAPSSLAVSEAKLVDIVSRHTTPEKAYALAAACKRCLAEAATICEEKEARARLRAPDIPIGVIAHSRLAMTPEVRDGVDVAAWPDPLAHGCAHGVRGGRKVLLSTSSSSSRGVIDPSTQKLRAGVCGLSRGMTPVSGPDVGDGLVGVRAREDIPAVAAALRAAAEAEDREEGDWDDDQELLLPASNAQTPLTAAVSAAAAAAIGGESEYGQPLRQSLQEQQQQQQEAGAASSSAPPVAASLAKYQRIQALRAESAALAPAAAKPFDRLHYIRIRPSLLPGGAGKTRARAVTQSRLPKTPVRPLSGACAGAGAGAGAAGGEPIAQEPWNDYFLSKHPPRSHTPEAIVRHAREHARRRVAACPVCGIPDHQCEHADEEDHCDVIVTECDICGAPMDGDRVCTDATCGNGRLYEANAVAVPGSFPSAYDEQEPDYPFPFSPDKRGQAAGVGAATPVHMPPHHPMFQSPRDDWPRRPPPARSHSRSPSRSPSRLRGGGAGIGEAVADAFGGAAAGDVLPPPPGLTGLSASAATASSLSARGAGAAAPAGADVLPPVPGFAFTEGYSAGGLVTLPAPPRPQHAPAPAPASARPLGGGGPVDVGLLVRQLASHVTDGNRATGPPAASRLAGVAPAPLPAAGGLGSGLAPKPARSKRPKASSSKPAVPGVVPIVPWTSLLAPPYIGYPGLPVPHASVPPLAGSLPPHLAAAQPLFSSARAMGNPFLPPFPVPTAAPPQPPLPDFGSTATWLGRPTQGPGAISGPGSDPLATLVAGRIAELVRQSAATAAGGPGSASSAAAAAAASGAGSSYPTPRGIGAS